MVYLRILNIFPCAIQEILVFIYYPKLPKKTMGIFLMDFKKLDSSVLTLLLA